MSFNTPRLLQHFERVSEAPDAIPRLRRFILDLAVRGKLVQQDPNDEPASELLKRIESEKVRLVKTKEIREPVTLSMIDPRNAPFTLPSNWVWTRIGDIFDYDAGRKREPKELNPDSWLLELEDIEKDTSIIHTRLTVAERNSLSTKSEFKAGDILYGKLRPYLNKVVLATEPGYSTTEIVAIRPYISLCPDYCCLALRRPDFVEYVNRVGQGTKMPRLRTQDALVAVFPLPPLAEQHRIVAKVDELMALCDQLEAAKTEREQSRDRLVAASLHRLNSPADTAENGEPDFPDQQVDAFRDHAGFVFEHLPRLTTRPEHIKQLRQTILNLAVRGKLVSQDPSDEPASALLERIQGEKARLFKEGIIPRQKVLSTVRKQGAFEQPVNWEIVMLSDVCNFVTSGSRGWAAFYSKSGPKFIRAQNIRFGKLLFDDLACVNPPQKSEGVRTRASKGDLVIVITGAGVTNPALLDHELGEAYVSQHVALINPTSTDLSRWLLLCLMAPVGGRADLVERAYGAGKPGLNLDNIRSLIIPLPPLAEQHRIVTKVDELMALCDQLDAQLITTEANSRRLLEAVLHEALNPLAEVAAQLEPVADRANAPQN
jgi:type I restriction enzyme, S subunit